MKMLFLPLTCAVAAVLSAGLVAPAQSAERMPKPLRMPASQAEPARVIVTYRDDARLVRQHPLAHLSTRDAVLSAAQRRTDALASQARVPLVAGRALGERQHVVKAEGLSSDELVRRLAMHPDVERVTVDARKRALLVPNDPLYTAGPTVNLSTFTGGPAVGQWYLKAPAGEVRSSIDAPAAWDLNISASGGAGRGVVVAVLDTGVLSDHVDLAGRMLPGYDFIVDEPTANDGGGRDADAKDAGDWITSAENASGSFKGCADPVSSTDSSWHGTKVSGIIGAATNNNQGIAGIAFGAQILPVRVLGKCGGYDSDIIAAMKWAAGLAVPGVPANPTPAKVLNMSLGSTGACSADYRDAVAAANAQGAVVVAAAGNSEGHAVGTPANCPGMIAVAGLRHAGTKVGFSDLGPEITIGAPGGNCINTGDADPCLYPIVTTTNMGRTVPLAGGSAYTSAFDITVGTSFAAPIVAGTAALVLSARPGLTPSEVKSVIQRSARAFPTSGADNGPGDATPVTACLAPTSTSQLQCYCSVGLCGAGMLDAASAVALATQSVFPRVSATPASPAPGDTITLSGASTLIPSSRAVTSWSWSLVDGGGAVSGYSGAVNGSTATLQPVAAGTVTVRLTVVDDQGRATSSDTAIAVGAAPASGGGGSSGGGAMAPGWLLGLLVASVALQRLGRRAGSAT